MSQLNAQERQQRPIRAGVFGGREPAHAAVDRLVAAGFTRDQITVVCSDETLEREFRDFEHERPAGTNTPAAAAAGVTLGAAVGGLAAGAAGIAAGALPLLIVGGAGLLTGGVLGGFLGAMLTRGFEKEAANFYDQAVMEGKLLVTVEDHGERSGARLARAEQILADAGAEPLPLAEG